MLERACKHLVSKTLQHLLPCFEFWMGRWEERGGTELASVSRKPFPYINIYVCIYKFQITFCSLARWPRKSHALITGSLRGRQGLKHRVLFQNREGRLQFLESFPWTRDKKLESICQVLDFSQHVAGTRTLKCGCEVGCEGREGGSLSCSFGCDRPFVLQLKYSPVIFDFQAVGLRFRVDSARAGKCKKKKKTLERRRCLRTWCRGWHLTRRRRKSEKVAARLHQAVYPLASVTGTQGGNLNSALEFLRCFHCEVKRSFFPPPRPGCRGHTSTRGDGATDWLTFLQSVTFRRQTQQGSVCVRIYIYTPSTPSSSSPPLPPHHLPFSLLHASRSRASQISSATRQMCERHH